MPQQGFFGVDAFFAHFYKKVTVDMYRGFRRQHITTEYKFGRAMAGFTNQPAMALYYQYDVHFIAVRRGPSDCYLQINQLTTPY